MLNVQHGMKLYFFIITLTITLSSCSTSEHREQGKIFHAGPSSGGIGSLYFALYDDKTYQICNSGGVGQDCYSGKFSLIGDTLTLIDLDNAIPLKSEKLLILRYAEQDSTYWKWKYEKSIGIWTWEHLQWRDLAIGGIGDVYQLNDKNELMKDECYFIIRLDSLKNHQ
jgi:hypothetical protein